MSRSDDPDVAGFDDRSSATPSVGAASASQSPSDLSLGSFTYPDVDDEPDEANASVRGRHAQPAKRRRLPVAPILVAAALALGLIAGGLVWLQPGPDGEEVAADSDADDEDNPFSGGAAGPPVSDDEEEEGEPAADHGNELADGEDSSQASGDGDTSSNSGQNATTSASSGDGQGGSSGDGGSSTSPTPEEQADDPEGETPGGESNERVGDRPPEPGERDDDGDDEEDEDDGCPSWICWW